MSTPITDTAEYLAEKEGSSTKLEQPAPLRIFSTNSSQRSKADPNQLISPESPEGRRPPPIHQSITDFDPKLQWQRVMKKLPNRQARSRKSSQDGINEVDNDHGSDIDEEEYENYEMTTHSLGSYFTGGGKRRNSLQHQHYVPPNEEDDILPSAEECGTSDNLSNENLPKQTEGDDNYFTNPFGSPKPEEEPATPTLEAIVAEDLNKKKKKWEKKEKKRLKKLNKQQQQDKHNAEESGVTTGDESDIQAASSAAEAAGDVQQVEVNVELKDGRAKKHWGKTLNRVKLIANLHTLPHQQQTHPEDTTIASTSSLAPYYPPLFDPVFIAMSKDQHGHPWVSNGSFFRALHSGIKITDFLSIYCIATCFITIFKSSHYRFRTQCTRYQTMDISY